MGVFMRVGVVAWSLLCPEHRNDFHPVAEEGVKETPRSKQGPLSRREDRGFDTWAWLRSSQITSSLPPTVRATTAWEGLLPSGTHGNHLQTSGCCPRRAAHSLSCRWVGQVVWEGSP